MTRLSVLVGFLILWFGLSAQSHIIPINDLQYEQSSFGALDPLFTNVKVVGLGESSHRSGGSFSAKIKMVKYLHEQCGFDVLAFESAMYELSVVGEGLKKGELTKKDIFSNLSGVWRVTEMNELFDYILETQKTDRPLIYVGVDAKFFGPNNIGNFDAEYSAFLSKLGKRFDTEIFVDSLFWKKLDQVRYNSYSYKKPLPSDTLLFFEKFKEINALLERANYKDDDYLYYWKQMTDNLQSVYRTNYHMDRRDYYMAQNVLYYTRKYPNSKIMVWAATYHVAKDLTSMAFYNRKGVENRVMGVYLSRALGSEYFPIAFSSLEGKAGVKGYLGIMQKRVRSNERSLERYFNDTFQASYGFIPLRDPSVQKELESHGIDYASLFGATMRKGDIPRVVDGVFYLKQERFVHFLEY